MNDSADLVLPESEDTTRLARCDRRHHYWPTDWLSGDTCNCGAFYLYQRADAGAVLVEAPTHREQDDD